MSVVFWNSVAELKDTLQISDALPQKPINKVIVKFRKRLGLGVNVAGGHFEHSL